MTISLLSDISSGQQVTIKGHLTDLFGSKKFMSKSGQALFKQDGLVSDPTGTIKVTFWGNFIDEAQKGKTYNFKQFVYKNDNYGIYLTTSTSVSILEEGEPFQQLLAKPEIDSKILAILTFCCVTKERSFISKFRSVRQHSTDAIVIAYIWVF